MTLLDIDPVNFLCEKLEELRDCNETVEQKRQRYDSDYRETVNKWVRQLQERAIVECDPSVLLLPLSEPVLHLEAVMKLPRHLMSHQPQEAALKLHRMETTL